MSAGPVGPVKSWVDRLLETAVALVILGLLLNWAWSLLRPWVPVMVVIAGLGVLVPVALRRVRGW